MKSAFEKIEEKIRIGIDGVVSDIAESDDSVAAAIVGRNTSPDLCINSSFLYREKSLKTTQSPRRLVARLAAMGKRVRAKDVWVIDSETITNHYKVISPQNAARLTPLSTGVAQEVGRVGDLLFTLLGTEKGMRPQTQQIECRRVVELRLDPSLGPAGGDVQKTAEGVYSMRAIQPIEVVFECINAGLGGQALSAEERRVVGVAYERMMEDATTEVAVPTGEVGDRGQTVLGRIVASLKGQADEYRNVLDTLHRDPTERRALHEVLRIAYNFSADVLPLISLFVSICDLKPLVFWCTIKEQWALRRAFGTLPWAALGRKEKLEEYKSIVSQARSHAFHHVLPFDATVEIDLSTLDVRAEKIRLFVPHGEKQGRGVHLRDQKLADVLAEFSRAKERPVSEAFWRANLKVMVAACELSEEVLCTLVLIHDARRETAGR